MGTYVDTTYRFEGTSTDIELAREAVADIQAEYEDCDGLQYEPKLGDDGSLTWSGYGKLDVRLLDRRLAILTRGKGLRVWAYVGCTDGCCEGELSLFEKGSFRMVDRWAADIGLCSAVAAINLSKKSDIRSALVLIDRVRIADGDGWDEYDWSHLRAGGVCSLILANAVGEHPELLQSPKVVDALQRVGKAMADIRKHLRKFKAMKKSDIGQIDGLLAVIEGLEIASAAKPCKAAKHMPVRV